MNNSRFDILSTNTSVYDEFLPGLMIELFQTEISFFKPNSQNTVSLANGPVSDSILQSLSYGVINSDLLSVCRLLKISNWIEGSLIVAVVDFRSQKEIKYVLKVDSCGESFDHYCVKKGLPLEQKLLLVTQKIVYLDPSRDVSRIFSVFDQRAKSWLFPIQKVEQYIEKVHSQDGINEVVDHTISCLISNDVINHIRNDVHVIN